MLESKVLEIKGKLESFLPIELYGQGEAKSFESLIEEIRSRECVIVWEKGFPLRVIDVLSIDIISPDRKRLFEAYQEFNDGRKRERGLWGISEKIKAGESSRAAIHRAIKEELGISGGILATHFNSVPFVEVKPSPSYPGLKTEYNRFEAEVKLSAEVVKPEGYIEIQPDKKTVFIWK